MKKLTSIVLVSLALTLALITSAADVILTPTVITTPTTISAEGDVFSRSLSVGSYGKDVMALKKLLGLEFGTTMESGSTFTATTKADVIKLQNKYAIEILIPVGLSTGTGFVGAASRPKLNQLANKYYIKLSDFTLPTAAASTASNIFITNLKVGSTGNDVVLLKTILNSDTATALVPKNSTNIFDEATKIAVIKFQEKYASEILTPSGLTAGTGYVGPSTRKKLNSIVSTILANAQSTNATTSKNTTVTPSTSGNTQTFTANQYSAPVSSTSCTPNEIVSTYCNYTTLVTKKCDGNGSPYTIQTYNSSQCASGSGVNVTGGTSGGSTNTLTPIITGFTIPANTAIVASIGTRDENGEANIILFTPPKYYYKIVKDRHYSFRGQFNADPILYSAENRPYTFNGTVTDCTTIGNGGSGVNKYISDFPWKCPFTYNLNLTPAITLKPSTGTTISPLSGVAQNFSNPVVYTVTGSNGSTTKYTVTSKPIDCGTIYKDGIPVSGTITSVDQKEWHWYMDASNLRNLLGGESTIRYKSTSEVYLVQGLTRSPIRTVDGTTYGGYGTDVNALFNAYCDMPIVGDGYLFQTPPVKGESILYGHAGTDLVELNIEGTKENYRQMWDTGLTPEIEI